MNTQLRTESFSNSILPWSSLANVATYTPRSLISGSANTTYQRPPSVVSNLNSWAGEALSFMRDIGRSYQRGMGELNPFVTGNGLRDVGNAISITDTSFTDLREYGEVRLSKARSLGLTGAKHLTNGLNGVVGVGDALVALADDYDQGNKSYSGFMKTVPKIVGQTAILGAAGIVAGGVLAAVSAPGLAIVGVGAGLAWGFGKLYDSIFG